MAEGDADLNGPRGSDGQGDALAVNNKNVIVGKTNFGGDDHATIWTPGKGGKYTAVDLNRYLPRGSTWVLGEATSINDAGVIVGTGTMGGTRTWMLVPDGQAGFTLKTSDGASVSEQQPTAAPAVTATAQVPARQAQSVFSQSAISEDLLA